MAKKRLILQIGAKSWQDDTPIPENLEWQFINTTDLDNLPLRKPITNQLVIDNIIKDNADKDVSTLDFTEKIKYDFVFLTDSVLGIDLTILDKISDYYTIVCDSKLFTEDETVANFLNRKFAHKLVIEDKIKTLDKFSRSLYQGQYGQKIGLDDVNINHSFLGKVSQEGEIYINFDGDFGEEFGQIINWNYNIVLNERDAMEFWPEFIIEGDCQIELRLARNISGSVADFVDELVYTMEDMKQPIIINSDGNYYLNVSIYAKGKGLIKVGHVHYRYSHQDFGFMSMGGERFADSKRQEFMYYFNPGDYTPPLNVYFSGYRKAEGFEAYGLIKGKKAPFLLFSDPRINGGSFYLGTAEYEAQIEKIIREKLDYLGFDNQQLIMTGASMGTFGALYYGSKLEPHAIIAWKPLVNLGNVAVSNKNNMFGTFFTALDVLLNVTGGTSQAHIDSLNQKFWTSFKQADFSKTTIVLPYMEHEEYDKTAYYDLVTYLGGKGYNVISKGFAGRHNDNFSSVFWFSKQFDQILELDFSRGKDAK